MNNFVPKHIHLSEIAVIITTILSIKLINYAQSIEEWFLSNTLKSVIIIGDISISFGIMANANFNGGVIIFFIYKIILQIFSQAISMVQVFLPSLLCYSIFKGVSILLVKVTKFDQFNIKDVSNRENAIKCQQKKRTINLLLLLVSSIVLFNLYLQNVTPLVTFIMFAVTALCVVVQIYKMDKSDDTLFKLIAHSLPYNLYIYVFINLIFAKIYFQDFTMFIKPTIILLIVAFFLMRVFMGSKSSKFHKGDLIFFEMAYIFKGDDGDKYYRSNKNLQRTLRVIDKLSREVVLQIYFLSVILAFYKDQFSYLFASIALIMNYPQQQQAEWKPITYLREKLELGLKFKWKLILPILFLVYLLINKQNTRKEQLYDSINQCSTINNLQLLYLSLVFTSVAISNLCRLDIQQKIFRIVQLICPLIIVLWVIWLQCVHKKLLALGLYVLVYCLEEIRDGRQARVKGGKRQ